MIFFVIIGMVLGGVSILFILQNVTPVTVSFFAYHLTGSLALVLFLALFAGMLITVLMLLPGYISDEFRVTRLKKLNKDLEDELTEARRRLAVAETQPTTVVVTDSTDLL